MTEIPEPDIIVVGLGPTGVELITSEVAGLLAGPRPVLLRTARHPAAAAVEATATYDDVYDSSQEFAEVYETIVADLIARAATEPIVYAVPGSPHVAERTVELLRHRSDVTVDVRPAMSFVDLAWSALGVDPLAESVTIVDAHRFSVAAAGNAGPFLVTQVDSATAVADLLDSIGDADHPVTLLARLGRPDETVHSTTLGALVDGDVDHLTSLWVAPLRDPVASSFQRFDDLVRRLRTDCPWDRAQTHRSLRKHLLEEAHEVLDAIDAVDLDRADAYLHLEEELGDLLFQVFFHSRLAAEAGYFTVADVADGIHDKLVDRHPHVFGDADADRTVADWELAKQAEKGRDSLLDGIPASLPALLKALKVQRRAAATGFSGRDLEWALADVREELAEVTADPTEHEVGDLLYAAVQVARMLEVDPEHALDRATQRFSDRFREVERLAAERGINLADQSQAELGGLWSEAKAAG